MKKFVENAVLLFLVLSVPAQNVQAAEPALNSGPLAAATALFIAGQHGHPNLCRNGVNGPALTQVAKALSSAQAMKNGLNVGTSSEFPLQGIERYIRACGYSSRDLKFQGYSLCPQAYSLGLYPKLDWICAGIRAHAGVCLLVGWYEHDSKKDIYRRVGGHWVNGISYQRNPYNKGVPITVLASNPSNGQQSWLYFEQIKSGKLAEIDDYGRPIRPARPATPYYKVMSNLPGMGGTGVLEGAVVFNL